MRIINVVGARPNFMKIAPLMRAYQDQPRIEPLLVHTGQHYDHKMSRLFFEELGIPRPDIDLEVGSGSHAAQTAEIMKRFEPVCIERQPDLVLVVGDVNSTIACALVAAKLGIRVAHVEAGLRSFDRSMPEEINRVLTDAISDLLFVTELSGEHNLLSAGVDRSGIHFVGDVMIDTLLANLDKAHQRDAVKQLDLTPRRYALLTLHRPSNVDDKETFTRIWSVIEQIAARLPVIFPCHPRTRNRLAEFGMSESIEQSRDIRLIEPQGYLEFLGLMAEAAVVMTDSGGIQGETTILKVPCLTLRENTEQPVTIECGANRLVGTGPERILAGFEEAINCDRSRITTPPLWDGHAAERIVQVLTKCEL